MRFIDDHVLQIDPKAFFAWMGWKMKKSGNSFRGCCPLHHGNNPNAFAYDRKGFFFCNTRCGFVGNFVDAYAKAKSCSRDQAFMELAHWRGLKIDKRKTHATEAIRKTEMKMNEKLEIKHYALPELSTHEWNGLMPLTVNDPWNQFGYDDQTIKRFGIQKAISGRYAGRVVFPIWDLQGRCVGLNGRLHDGSDPTVPRYLYSTFERGHVLYHLHRVILKDRTRPIFVCEGIRDVIRLDQWGIDAVAVLGSHVTKEQADILVQQQRPIVLCFDGDEAGKKGMKQSIQVLDEWYANDVRVVSLPAGEDPDSVSHETWLQCIDHMKSAKEWLLTSEQKTSSSAFYF